MIPATAAPGAHPDTPIERFEFWAKRWADGRFLEVTVIVFADTVENARAKIDALGVHSDVAAFT